jgi:hypothetical protein
MSQSRKGRLKTGQQLSAVPAGTVHLSAIAQDCVLGYPQTSLRDCIQALELIPQELVVDVVVKLYLGRFDNCAQQASTPVSGGSL